MNTEKILLGGRKRALPEEIIYLKGEVNYSIVFFSNGNSYLTCTTLKTLENRLHGYGFFRTNKSSLINLDFVKNYETLPEKGIVELQNNELIEVSRRKNRILRNILTVHP